MKLRIFSILALSTILVWAVDGASSTRSSTSTKPFCAPLLSSSEAVTVYGVNKVCIDNVARTMLHKIESCSLTFHGAEERQQRCIRKAEARYKEERVICSRMLQECTSSSSSEGEIS